MLRVRRARLCVCSTAAAANSARFEAADRALVLGSAASGLKRRDSFQVKAKKFGFFFPLVPSPRGWAATRAVPTLSS